MPRWPGRRDAGTRRAGLPAACPGWPARRPPSRTPRRAPRPPRCRWRGPHRESGRSSPRTPARAAGPAETAVNAVAVIAWLTPSRLVDTTTMPLANRLADRRKAAGSTAVIAAALAAGCVGPARPEPETGCGPDGGADRTAVEVPLPRGGIGDDHAARGRRQGQHERGGQPADGGHEPAEPRAHPRPGQQAGHQDQRGEPQRRQRKAAHTATEQKAPDQAFHGAKQEQQHIGHRYPECSQREPPVYFPRRAGYTALNATSATSSSPRTDRIPGPPRPRAGQQRVELAGTRAAATLRRTARRSRRPP